MTPQQRSRQARMAAHKMHSKHDALETTAKARAVFLDRFEKEVDPSGKLSPQERAKRAQHARSAYFQGLAMRSAQERRGTLEAPPAEHASDTSKKSGQRQQARRLHIERQA